MMDNTIRDGKAAYESKMEAMVKCWEKRLNERQQYWKKVSHEANAKMESKRCGFETIIQYLNDQISAIIVISNILC